MVKGRITYTSAHEGVGDGVTKPMVEEDKAWKGVLTPLQRLKAGSGAKGAVTHVPTRVFVGDEGRQIRRTGLPKRGLVWRGRRWPVSQHAPPVGRGGHWRAETPNDKQVAIVYNERTGEVGAVPSRVDVLRLGPGGIHQPRFNRLAKSHDSVLEGGLDLVRSVSVAIRVAFEVTRHYLETGRNVRPRDSSRRFKRGPSYSRKLAGKELERAWEIDLSKPI